MDEYDGPQYVGIDLHRRCSVIVRMTPDSERLGPVKRIFNEPWELAREVASWGESPEVVLEATCGWYWAADVLPHRRPWLISSGAASNTKAAPSSPDLSPRPSTLRSVFCNFDQNEPDSTHRMLLVSDPANVAGLAVTMGHWTVFMPSPYRFVTLEVLAKCFQRHKDAGQRPIVNGKLIPWPRWALFDGGRSLRRFSRSLETCSGPPVVRVADLLVAVRLLRVPGFTLAALVADAAMSTEAGRGLGRPTALRWRACRRLGLDRGCLGGRPLPARSGPAGGRGLGLLSGVPGLAHGSLGVHLAHARSVAVAGRFFGVPCRAPRRLTA